MLYLTLAAKGAALLMVLFFVYCANTTARRVAHFYTRLTVVVVSVLYALIAALALVGVLL